MNILITGSSGFCGSFLKKYFEKNNSNTIFSISRKSENGHHILFDLRNPIPESLISENIDCVIHCASVVDEKHSDYSILDDNLKIAYNIQKLIQIKKPKLIINMSSVSVYGRPNSENIDESFVKKPNTTYGISKLLIENLFDAMTPLATNHVNLRLGYVIGDKIPKKSVLSRFQYMLKKNEQITLTNPDLTKFSFIDLFDIAKTCEIFMKKNLSGNYNLVGDKSLTLREVLNSIRNFYPNYNKIIAENENTDTIYSTTFSNQKIKNIGMSFKNYVESFKEIFTASEF